MNALLQWKRATPWAQPIALSDETLPPILGAIMTETLLYGVHVVLFFACVYLLTKHQLRLQWVILTAIILMFLITTGDMAFSYHVVTRQTHVLHIGTTGTLLRKIFPKFTIYVTNNLIASLLMIARFYVVWGQRWYLLAVTVPPLLVATGLGYACRISDPQTIRRFVPPHFLINLIMNNVLTVLTAGRIWWLSRRATNLTEGRGRQYRLTSAILIESGVLYSASMLLLIGLSSTRWTTVAAAIMIRTVAIVPVLMVVQISLSHSTSQKRAGRNANKTRDISTFADVESEAARTSDVVLDTVVRMPPEAESNCDLTSLSGSTMDKYDLELQTRRSLRELPKLGARH